MPYRSLMPEKDSPASAVPSFSNRLGAWFLDLLLITTLLTLPLTWFFDPLRINWGPIHTTMSWGWKPLVIPLLLLVVRQALRAKVKLTKSFLSTSATKKALASWLVTWGFFMAGEGILALLNVKPEASSPIVIRGEEDIDTKFKKGDNKVIEDPELLWRFAPNVRWGEMHINSLGFRDHEFTANKQTGEIRVISMGDSCTAQGAPPYSTLLNALLEKSAPTTNKWHAYNTGVFGYSSMQGIRQFEKSVRSLHPDVVTLYYGWNDHWLFGKPDHLRMAVRLSPMRALFADALRKKRFYNTMARVARTPQLMDSSAKEGELDYRVPPNIYEATLKEFVSEIRELGAVPLLITAPSRKLTDAIVRSGHAHDKTEADRAHIEYVEITRKVARETNTPLLDLAAIMQAPEYDALFLGDGIHFEQEGLQFIAQQIHAKLMELGVAGYFNNTSSTNRNSVAKVP